MVGIDSQADGLKEPFPVEQIKWIPGVVDKSSGKAMVFAYLDSRHVQRRLDDVLGVGGWSSEMQMSYSGCKCICTITANIDGCECSKTDGSAMTSRAWGKTKKDEDFEVLATKTMYSDAFKRAAVHLGVGRYLYDVRGPRIQLRNGKIPREMYNKLYDLLDDAADKDVITKDLESYADPEQETAGVKSEEGVQPKTKLMGKAKECVAELVGIEDPTELTEFVDYWMPMFRQLKAAAPKWWDNQEGDVTGLYQRVCAQAKVCGNVKQIVDLFIKEVLI